MVCSHSRAISSVLFNCAKLADALLNILIYAGGSNILSVFKRES